MSRCAVLLRGVLLACGGFSLFGMQDDPGESLLQILKPRYPSAAFHATLNGRHVCRLGSRVYPNPDRIGPDRGGITVEFEQTDSRTVDVNALPPPSTQDQGTFKVHTHTLLSGDGHGLLRLWIKVPVQDPPPSDLLEAIVESCRSYAATWKAGPTQMSDPSRVLLPPGAWDYPGGDNMNSLDESAAEPPFVALEDIADCGQVYLHPSGDRCLLVWYSPDEGIGYSDVVLYKKYSEGWKLRRVVKRVLLPRIQQGFGFAVVRAKQPWSWPKMVLRWPTPGPMQAIQR